GYNYEMSLHEQWPVVPGQWLPEPRALSHLLGYAKLLRAHWYPVMARVLWYAMDRYVLTPRPMLEQNHDGVSIRAFARRCMQVQRHRHVWASSRLRYRERACRAYLAYAGPARTWL